MFQELASHPEVRLGHCDSLLVMVWRGEITAESLQRTSEVETELIKRFPAISVIGVVTPEARGQPSEALIRGAAQAARLFETAVRGTAIVLSGGRAKSLARIVVDGLGILVGDVLRIRTFDDISEALKWLRTLPKQDATFARLGMATELQRFIDESVVQ